MRTVEKPYTNPPNEAVKVWFWYLLGLLKYTRPVTCFSAEWFLPSILHTAWFWQSNCQGSRDHYIFGSFAGLKSFLFDFIQDPIKQAVVQKGRLSALHVYPHNHCHFYSFWLKFSCVKRAPNMMGGLFVFSQDTTALTPYPTYCLPHLSSLIQITVHASLSLHPSTDRTTCLLFQNKNHQKLFPCIMRP